MSRPAPLGSAVLFLVLTTVACSAPGAADLADAPSPPESSAPTYAPLPLPPKEPPDPEARVPLGAERPPESFSDETDRLVTGINEVLDEDERPGTDDEMLAAAQGACSAVSSGGMVAEKFHFWAGQQGYGEGWNVPLVGGILVLCPEYQDGYLTDRQLDIEPTAPERADLARFIVRRGTGEDALASTSDRALARKASNLCRLARGNPGAVADLDPMNDRGRSVLVLALLLAYCQDVTDQIDLPGRG